MILEEIVIRNFGIFLGCHQFNLAPESDKKPVILIGAHNGAGKTTFLEALQLAFFGKLGGGGRSRGVKDYDGYLRRSINSHASPNDGAEIRVKFHRVVNGQDCAFEIRRSWSANTKRVREKFKVMVNGNYDRVLTSQWDEFIEDILPPRIAPLFFFDGEKIEYFADLEKSSEIIETGINALLGLDIVEQLKIDLDVLKKRKLIENESTNAHDNLSKMEECLTEAEARLHSRKEEAENARLNVEQSTLELQRARTALNASGGDVFAAREALVADHARIDQVLENTRKELISWASGTSPLSLVHNLIQSMTEQSEQELKTETSKSLLSHLTKRDQVILSKMRQLNTADDIIHEIETFFIQDNTLLKKSASQKTYLDLPRSAHMFLINFVEKECTDMLESRRPLVDKIENLEREKEDVQRKISSIPATEIITPFIKAVSDAETKLRQSKSDFHKINQEREETNRDVLKIRKSYQDILEKMVDTKLQTEDRDRLLKHLKGVRQTLSRFTVEVVKHNIEWIEHYMLNGLKEIFRKDDLISRVVIDPETFEIKMHGSDEQVVPPGRLSAGERQLFAIALLWALAQTSGHEAPTVIDTPLGRLDSQHRRRLVERYFPHAGAQVILLSTDEEIDAKLYKSLTPHISRSFTIVYDSKKKSSQVFHGYAFSKTKERKK